MEKNSLLSALSAVGHDLLRPNIGAARLNADSLHFLPGDDSDSALFITRGFVVLQSPTREGRLVGLASIGREGVVGLPGEISSLSWERLQIYAPVAVEGWQTSLGALRGACKEIPELEDILRGYSKSLSDRILDTVACLAYHDPESRVARWLLDARRHTGKKRFFITENALADMLGVSRSTVSRALDSLKRRGLILHDYGHLTIADPRGIRRAAHKCCESHAPVKKYSANASGL